MPTPFSRPPPPPRVGGPPAGGLYDGEGHAHPFGSVPGFGWSNGVFVDFEQRLRPSDTL